MKKFFLWFRSFCVSSFPFVAFALVIANFFVSCSVYRASHPRYFYRTFVITNEVVSVVSNSFSSLPSSSSLSVSSPEPVPYVPPSYPVRYDYIVLNGRPVARLFGRPHFEGDLTSRGRILCIFPDRIILNNGIIFDNVYDDSDSSRRVLPKRKAVPGD